MAPRRTLATLLCIALMSVGAAASGAGASESPSSEPAAPSRPKAGGWAPYPEDTVTPSVVGSPISAGGCTYQQANDDPHLTSGDVSIHGWWQRVTKTALGRAHGGAGGKASTVGLDSSAGNDH